jgi:hypothetical protein
MASAPIIAKIATFLFIIFPFIRIKVVLAMPISPFIAKHYAAFAPRLTALGKARRRVNRRAIFA